MFLQHNTFPVHLGINISCVTPEETTRTGHKYAMTCLANSNTQFPLVIHESQDNSEHLEWRTKYPMYNSNNLDKQGVLDVSGQQFTFVDENHPVIELLRQNKEMLNANIDDQPKIDGQWFKITKQVFSTCCSTLRNKVLNKVMTRDLNNFSVTLNRVGRNDWTTNIQSNDEIMAQVPTGILFGGDEQAITQEVTGILKKVCTYSALLEINYDIHA